MSSTRHKQDPNAPLSFERYMSSPEFSGLSAISGTAVAKRCALLSSDKKRALIWFIQAMSQEPGSLKAMAKALWEMFPKRIDASGFKTDARRIIMGEADLSDQEALAVCRDVAFGRSRSPASCSSIEEFLVDLCINPGLSIQFKGEASAIREIESDRIREQYPEIQVRAAKLDYFADVTDAIAEFKRRYEASVEEKFCKTTIGRKIWAQLDKALRTQTMCVIDGLEGRGKTEAVSAWCRCHAGVARFVSLDGTSTKTTQFRELARALGIGHSGSRKVSEMQAGVKDVLRISKLMLVVDEAHFFFNQGPRMYTRPEMLDWIDTALCNSGVPVALVTTPQFMLCMERAADQVGWNYRQFQRRCKSYLRLPARNTPEDMKQVAKWLLPGVDAKTISSVVGYAIVSKRDLSAVGDVVREARLLAQEHDDEVGYDHVHRAIHEVLMPSDVPWAEMRARIAAPAKKAGKPERQAHSEHGAELPPAIATREDRSATRRETLEAEQDLGDEIRMPRRSAPLSAEIMAGV